VPPALSLPVETDQAPRSTRGRQYRRHRFPLRRLELGKALGQSAWSKTSPGPQHDRDGGQARDAGYTIAFASQGTLCSTGDLRESRLRLVKDFAPFAFTAACQRDDRAAGQRCDEA
jgi:hypothetical protein